MMNRVLVAAALVASISSASAQSEMDADVQFQELLKAAENTDFSNSVGHPIFTIKARKSEASAEEGVRIINGICLDSRCTDLVATLIWDNWVQAFICNQDQFRAYLKSDYRSFGNGNIKAGTDRGPFYLTRYHFNHFVEAIRKNDQVGKYAIGTLALPVLIAVDVIGIPTSTTGYFIRSGSKKHRKVRRLTRKLRKLQENGSPLNLSWKQEFVGFYASMIELSCVEVSP